MVPERGVGHAPGVGEQTEEEVAGADLPMAELAGDVRRLGDGDPGLGVESGVHVVLLESSGLPRRIGVSRGSASGEPPGG